jgi:uncharacterized protein (DUF952 family)
MRSNELLFHIAPAAAWAQGADPFVPDGFAADGFVHCCTRRQVVHVANAFFRGRSDLVLLLVDATRVSAPIRFENTNGGPELFPHVYGALPRAAIVAAEPMAARADGGFDAAAVDKCLATSRAGSVGTVRERTA